MTNLNKLLLESWLITTKKKLVIDLDSRQDLPVFNVLLQFLGSYSTANSCIGGLIGMGRYAILCNLYLLQATLS